MARIVQLSVRNPPLYRDGVASLMGHKSGVSRLFGKQFAATLFTLPVGGWQGPIASGYGLHLVRISEKTQTWAPELDAVRERVRDEWLAGQSRKANEAFYSALRKRYEIIVEAGVNGVEKATELSVK